MSVGAIMAGSAIGGALAGSGGTGKGERKRATKYLDVAHSEAANILAPLRDQGMEDFGNYRKAVYARGGGGGFDIPGQFRPQNLGTPGEFGYSRKSDMLMGTPGTFQAQNLGTPDAFRPQNMGTPDAFRSQNLGTPDEFQFNLQADPGYQFAQQQAMQEVERAMAARGYNRSGNLLNALNDRAVGVASQYANDAFNRQRSAFDANMDRSGELFGRQLGTFGANMGRSSELFGRQLGTFGANMDRSGELFGRQLGTFGANMDRSNALFGRRLGAFDANMRRSDSLYGRQLGTWGANMDRSNVLYGRDQDHLNRLGSLGEIGVNTTNQLAGNRLALGSGQAAVWSGAAAQQPQINQWRAQGLNNAVQGGIQNYLLDKYLGGRRPAGPAGLSRNAYE